MDARVSRLEESTKRVDVSLAIITEQLRHLATAADVQGIRTEIATLSAKIDGKAGATDLSELKGRVGRIPTVPVMLGVITIAGFILEAIPWLHAHVVALLPS